MAFGSLLILTASAFGADRPTEDTIAFQGFIGFEKAITDDLGFVTQLGWFQADQPRFENELTQPFTMDVKSPSLSLGLRYEFGLGFFGVCQ